MNEKILILGGTEFVGRQLVEILSSDPTKEIYLFNRGKTNPDLFPNVKRIVGDRETNDVEKLKMHQWDYVIDFSSYYPRSLQNTLAQINKTVKKYIYISTISVYDFKGYDSSFSIEEDYKMLTCSPEEAVDQTMKTYGRKKVACEAVLNEADWLNSIILRPSIIYGNYDPTDRFYYWLRKIKTSKEIILPDHGVDNLSLTYANDLVAIILKGINEDLPNGIYNCNTQETGTLKSMLETMKDLLDSDCQFYGMEAKVLKEEKIRFPLFFIGNLLFSNTRIKEASDLTFASFRDTIKSQIAYYETEGWRACKAGMTNEEEMAIIEKPSAIIAIMKILIAPDKFKGSVTAMEACQAIKAGIKIANPKAKCILHPMADGGDGSLAILKKHLKSEFIWVATKDPLGRSLRAPYFIHQSSAYIEMAQASGLALLSPEERNPLFTDSIGTGILIKDALDKNISKIVLLAGGSATNDGGMGIAHTLGFRFYDKMAKELLPIGKHLIQIAQIEKPINLPDFDLELLYDVNNPLCGPDGAARIYAGQKGADQAAISLLDDGLKNLAKVIEKQFNRSIANVKGAGSAGGLGGGLYGLLNAQLNQGFKKIAELTNLEDEIKKSDLVITGEGRLDEQSLNGKVVGGILNYCKIHQTRVQAIVGANHLSNEVLKETNIEKVFSIMSQTTSEKEAMNEAASYLTQLAVELTKI